MSDEPRPRRELPGWLQAKLFERRIVLVTSPLDEESAAHTAAALLSLDGDSDRAIELHVDCAEATLSAAFALIDTVDLLRAEVHAYCRGIVGGPAIGVVAAARHRVAAPHARFHLAQPRGRFTGAADDIAAQNRQQQDLLWRLHTRLAHRAGRAAEDIAEDMRRGRWFDAGEAVVYGLVDEVSPTRPGLPGPPAG
jgi:ATP-dependent Clp protease, protease subunit